MPALKSPKHILAKVETFAATQRDKVALIDEHRTITYGELMTEIINTQMALENSFHLKPGVRTGFLFTNTIDCVVAFLALIRSGATVVIINTKLAKPEVDFIIEDSNPMLILIGSENFLPLVAREMPKYLIEQEQRKFHQNSTVPERRPPAGFDDEDCAVIMYTSGTTGRPKGAMITHHNITYAVDAYIEDCGLTAADSTIIMVPMFYVTGLIAQLAVFLSLGGQLVLLKKFDEDEALRQISKYRITHLHSVATVYLRLVNGMERMGQSEKGALTCVRQALCGGGPITDALIGRLKLHLPWLEFRRVYGLTESTSAGVLMPDDVQKMPERSGASGLPMLRCQIKVVDDEEREVNPGIAGELLIKGENIIKRYWNNSAANRKSFLGEWLKTGDIAKIDRDGYIYILDRKKDMIIRGGEKVFSSEVEGALALYPGIKEVAVVGVPDDYYGESVKAFIVPAEKINLDPNAIIRFARTKLAKYKVPAVIELIDELPKSPVGKVLKTVLKNKGINRTIK
jgi:long-chain acyl-CoA synthetase